MSDLPLYLRTRTQHMWIAVLAWHSMTAHTSTHTLPPSALPRTIFVMEDVDAASDVVHRRAEGPATPAIPLELLKKMHESSKKESKKKEKKDAEIQAVSGLGGCGCQGRDSNL